MLRPPSATNLQRLGTGAASGSNVSAMAAADTLMGPFDSEVTVRRTRYVNEGTGWAVVEAAGDDGDELVLVGPLSHLERRERVHVQGAWVDDVRFGPQVKVTQA